MAKRRSSEKAPAPVGIEPAAPEDAKSTEPAPAKDAQPAKKGKDAPPAPKIDVVCTYEKRQILASASVGDGCYFRVRAHRLGAPGYVCSDWVESAGTAILPVEQASTYRVGIQVQGEAGRGPWVFVDQIEVPKLSPLKPGR